MNLRYPPPALPQPGTALPQSPLAPVRKTAVLLGSEGGDHDYPTLYFLTLLRQESVQAYLEAILKQQYGRAGFLAGGLLGIDAVLTHVADEAYARFLEVGKMNLQQALAGEHWERANHWKGYLAGVQLAARVVRSVWYDPRQTGDRLNDWFEMHQTTPTKTQR